MARKSLSDQNLNNNKVINLANGTASSDAVNKSQLDTKPTGDGVNKITVGTTAPSSPATGDVWIDTN